MQKKTLIISLIPIITWGQEIRETPSTIQKVIVYFRGASIVRSANLDIKPGINQYKLVGLSQSLQPNSIQLQLSESCNIMSMTTSQNYMELKKPNGKLEAVDD
ncbi:MAG TPA: DUF4140 domain-containing protein, partial [Cytophagales bacterium]|nr:DUF4140 domain-containing protein [Cytophagales bacterium]